jgi:IclR family pca regulon transcriptional regulator
VRLGGVGVAVSALERGAPYMGAVDSGLSAWGRDLGLSESMGRGLAVLELFGGERRFWGVAEVGRRLGMSRSTAHRYLSTLQKLGYLEQGEGRRYGLTLAVTRLGCSAMSSTCLVVQASATMLELARQIGFAVELAVLDGPDVLLVERVECRGLRAARAGWVLGGELFLPAYCTALGKLLLATLPDSAQCDLLDELVFERLTPSTLTSKQMLGEELLVIRESGLGVCDEELEVGLVGVAAVVRDERGEVCAALGWSARRSSITVERLADGLGVHLLSAADQISARLGYRRSDERGKAVA